MQEVTLRVPASTSNLGPGFDCMGVALRIYNEIKVTRRGRGQVLPIVAEAAEVFFRRAGLRSFSFRVEIGGEIPRARGLGSSAAVRLGVMAGLNELAKRPLSKRELFEAVVELEGHPDNVAPALFGGFNLVRQNLRVRFPVNQSLRFVLVVPDLEISTKKARGLLPATIRRKEAAENSANAALIAAAFAQRKYANLRGAFVDHLHQPYRKKLVPCLFDVIGAGEKAGALGGFLSGSGSAMACVTLVNPGKVAAAMCAAMPPGMIASVRVVSADNQGTRLVTGRARA